ncbi:hypothetical protein ACUUL3_02555 [Thiovibrio sp. JS02]
MEIKLAEPLADVARLRGNHLGRIKVLVVVLLGAIGTGVLGMVFDPARESLYSNTAFTLFVSAGFAFVYSMEKLQDYKEVAAGEEKKMAEFARDFPEVDAYLRRVEASGRKPVAVEYETVVAFVDAKKAAGEQGR